MNENTLGFKDWKQEQAFPGCLTFGDGEMRKDLIVNSPANGTLTGEFSAFRRVLWSHLTFRAGEEISCQSESHGKRVTLFFDLAGSLRVRGAWHSEETIAKGQHSIYYSANKPGDFLIVPDGGMFQCLEINLPVDYYLDLLRGHSELQDKFIRNIVEDRETWIGDGPMSMTLPMKWLINALRQNARTGVMKRLFLEARTLELLMLQVEQAESLAQLRSSSGRTSEVDALHEAKAILERSIDNPPTIRTLARMVGLNEFSLKKGFKDTFNQTVYGFVHSVKMQQAKQLLLDGNKSINDVSEMAGYKNPQHFTAAFKKYFGILPSKLKT
jgi:AraC-like DNA-binding protein